MLLAEQELGSGRLVVLFPEPAMSVRGNGFVTMRSKADTPKVRDFRAWLFAELEQTRSCWEEFLTGDGRRGRHAMPRQACILLHRVAQRL